MSWWCRWVRSSVRAPTRPCSSSSQTRPSARPVVLGLADADHVEVLSGVKAGESVIVEGHDGLPDGAAVKATDDREMSIAALAIRHSRAAAVIAVALVVAGVVAAFSLPSSIYPPLQFPRIVDHRAQRDAAVAVDDADRHAAARAGGDGGARDPPRALDEHPRRHRDLRAVRPGHRHGRGAPAGSEPGVGDPRATCPADTELTVERLTPAVFPMFILNLTGSLPTPDLNDYALYVMRPALARVPGVGRVEVLASDTREIEVVVDPLKLLAAGLTVTDVAEALKSANQLRPVGRFSESGQQHLVLASGLWRTADEIAATPVAVKNGATIRVADLARSFPARPTARSSSPATDATPSRSASRSRSAPTSWT